MPKTARNDFIWKSLWDAAEVSVCSVQLAPSRSRSRSLPACAALAVSFPPFELLTRTKDLSSELEMTLACGGVGFNELKVEAATEDEAGA